jgi:molybdopterin converting factor subunit 1
MKVTVRFFGPTREALGNSNLEQDIPRGSTARDLVNLVVGEYPSLEPYSRLIRVAVNRRYARMEAPLSEGDEVALIPPVAGG